MAALRKSVKMGSGCDNNNNNGSGGWTPKKTMFQPAAFCMLRAEEKGDPNTSVVGKIVFLLEGPLQTFPHLWP